MKLSEITIENNILEINIENKTKTEIDSQKDNID